jgi:predicted dehydrogenase
MTGQSVLRVALIGFGRQGKVHFEALQQFVDQKQVTICGICDVLPEAAITDIPFFTNAPEMITNIRPDIVIITVPNVFHFSLTKLALEHECDVVKEKPLSISFAEGETLQQLAKKHGRLIITTQQRFYQPLFQLLKNTLPMIGQLQRFSYVFTVNDLQKSWYWERALAGGGSWLNMGWHTLAVLDWLIGKPTSVQVAWNIGGHRDWHYDTDHSALARLTFANKIQGNIFVSCIAPKEEKLKLYGSEGIAQLSRKSLTIRNSFGKIESFSTTDSGRDYVSQYHSIFRFLRTRNYDMKRDLDILESIQEGTNFAQQQSFSSQTTQGESYVFRS